MMGRGTGRGIASLLLNMYSQGLLGGLPAEERKAKLAWFKAKSGGLEQLGEISKKPVWSKLGPEMEYEPAAEKLLPGQQRMEAGGQAYRVPSGTRREEMVGKTYGELGALGGIVKDLPIQAGITAKSSAAMQRPWLREVMPPEQVEEMTTAPMFPTEAIRKVQELQTLSKEKDVLPEQRKGVENILGGLADDVIKILYGIKEKEKQEVAPSPFTLSPGQKRFPGEGGEPIAEVDPIEKAKGQANKEKLTNYKGAINQTLKKYGIESGLIIKPDGTIDLEAFLSGKKSVYQTLQKKAAEGHIRAAQDLDKIDYWYGKIDELTGVPPEIMQRSEEERELDAIDPLRIR